jgi:glycyl-tRNA synthetase beta chain
MTATLSHPTAAADVPRVSPATSVTSTTSTTSTISTNSAISASTQPLLIELFVEELPPKVLKKLGESFATVLHASLAAQGLCAADTRYTAFASPRRLGVLVDGVAAQGQDKTVVQKLMPAAVGLAADGSASPALLKKLAALGAADTPVSALKNDAGTLFLDSAVKGATLAQAAQIALDEALAKLPIPKVMQYQLSKHCAAPGWSTVSFVRPAHGLVALHGADIVPLSVLGLQAGRSTQGHRFEAAHRELTLSTATAYEMILETQGAVIPSFAKRRAAIVSQLNAAAQAIGNGVMPIQDEALLDEVTALVERPKVMVCAFEREFLDVPQECLILTMKANQKYFPLLDAAGRLTHQFLIVSNIDPADPSFVIGGNERVVRPRLADAKFFFDQDRKKTLASRIEGLKKVVYHNKLGTQGERSDRVAFIAHAIGTVLGGNHLAQQAQHAAWLAKCDLLTDMVGEFPELQGTMGRYYALHDGEDAATADAIEDHYKPRFAGDSLPRATDGKAVGTVVALADKLETLVGLFGIGAVPTGDKDPFALRRHALGVIRLLADNQLPLSVDALIELAAKPFGTLLTHPLSALQSFIGERLAGQLREQGYGVQAVEAVLSLNPDHLYDIPARLAAVKAFADLPEAPALAAANKRVGNILKKIEGTISPTVNAALLQEPAEQALYHALQSVVPTAQAAFAAGHYTASLQALAALKSPVDAFFDSVMVNAEDAALRANRQGLLAHLHSAMNQIADLSKLAA